MYTYMYVQSLGLVNSACVYVTGYGDTWSILSVNQHTALPGLPAVQHSGYIYTCNIDLPGVPGVFIESVWISGT